MMYLVKGKINCKGVGYAIKKDEEIIVSEVVGKKLIQFGYVELKKAIDEEKEVTGGKKGGKK